MRPTIRPLALLLCAAATVAMGWSLATPSAAESRAPSASVGAPSVELAIVATKPGASRSALYFVRPGAPLPKASLAFQHLADSSPRAALMPGSRVVLATARSRSERDRSFDTGLWRLEPGAGARLLAQELVHGERPLITPEGRVFVTRGKPGPAPTPGELRVDELRVDAIDPQTGSAQTAIAFHGYVLHLAGHLAGELLVYRVGPKGADLIAIDPDGGSPRVLRASIPAFARDFSVDPGRGVLVYRNRDEDDARAWVVDELDLTSGAQRRRFRGRSFALAPHAWPDGGIALNPRRSGLTLLGSGDGLRSPLGPGVDWIRAVSNDGRFVAALHTRQGRLPIAFVVDRDHDASHRLPSPPGARVALAGILEGRP